MLFATLAIGTRFRFADEGRHGRDIMTKVGPMHYRRAMAGEHAVCLPGEINAAVIVVAPPFVKVGCPCRPCRERIPAHIG
jgi:hypothetical protein